MKRAAAVVVAVAALSGCGPSGPVCPPGTADCFGYCSDLAIDPANCGACGRACGQGQSCDAGQCVITAAAEINLYWEFERNTFLNGVPGLVPYDQDVNTSRCQQSGVDYVVATDGFGNYLGGPSIPCVVQGVQGATLTVPAGPLTVRVRGYRNAVPGIPLYDGQTTVNLVVGPPVPVTVVASGVPSPLSVTAVLTDIAGTYPTCGLAGIQWFDATLKDGLGTTVWQNSISCLPNDTPGVTFGSVDLDDLFMWMDAIDTRTVPAGQIIWSTCQTPIAHFSAQALTQPLPLGVCQPGP
jgi:hypothetical protein